MGGASGGPRRIGEVRQLIEKAKQELKAKRNVFISFAHEDLDEINLLRGQAKNDNVPIEFNDWSVTEPYNSERAAYIKANISDRIAQSSVTIVYISEHSSESEWVEWEIARSLELGKNVIGVYKGTSRPGLTFPALTRPNIKWVPWRDLASELKSIE